MSLIAVSALLFSISYAFGQYVEAKDHNLAVLKPLLDLCFSAEGLTTETVQQCTELNKKQFIFKYPVLPHK